MTAPSAAAVRGLARRDLTIGIGRARAELVRAIGEAGFALEIDQLTVLEAARGSAIAGASRSADKLPLRLRIRLTAADPGCSVWIEVSDYWKLPVRRPVEHYRDVIVEILGAIDLAVRRADPGASEFADPEIIGGPIGASSESGGSQAIAKFSGAANRYLDGGVPATQRRKGWRETGTLLVMTPKASTVFEMAEAYGIVTVGTMVVSRPGGMPGPLVSEIGKVVAAFEAALQGGPAIPGASVELDGAAVPAIEFLAQQARIREKVAIRTLQVCTTCRLTKVVNPDYTKLKAKRHRTNILSNSIGAVISTGGVSPFVLIGRLAQLNQLDLEFVCPRCQGLHAESSLITFCPKCGDQRNDSVLRSCDRCKFEFRALGSTKDLWDEPIQRPLPHATPALPPAGMASEVVPWPMADETAEQPRLPADRWAPPRSAQRVSTLPPAHPVSWEPPTPAQQVLPPPMWSPDPMGRHQLRWWDGHAWTAHALSHGRPVVDPL